MTVLERVKAAIATDLATPAVSAFDLAALIAVVEAAQGVVALSKLITERWPKDRVPQGMCDAFYSYQANGHAEITFTTIHAIADALSKLDKP